MVDGVEVRRAIDLREGDRVCGAQVVGIDRHADVCKVRGSHRDRKYGKGAISRIKRRIVAAIVCCIVGGSKY